MGFLPDEWCAAWRGSHHNLGLFFRMETDPTLNLWFGFADIHAEIADLDVEGTIYKGGGLLVALPNSLEVLLNGTTDSVQWTMNGVDPRLTDNLHDDAPSVLGARTTLALAPMDARWQLAANPVPIWEGIADSWSESQPIQADETKVKTRTLTLSTMTGDTSRALPYFATWTDPVQRLISPSDAFCNRTPRYFQGYLVHWPT